MNESVIAAMTYLALVGGVVFIGIFGYLSVVIGEALAYRIRRGKK